MHHESKSKLRVDACFSIATSDSENAGELPDLSNGTLVANGADNLSYTQEPNMTHYTELTSEKYLNESIEKEILEAREDRNAKAMQALTTMACALAVFAITLYSALNVTRWIEMIQAWLS